MPMVTQAIGQIIAPSSVYIHTKVASYDERSSIPTQLRILYVTVHGHDDKKPRI
jgi:hypothetical protein